MKIVPVLDVRGGVAVHALAGERSKYRPVKSVVCASSDPRELAASFRSELGLDALYVADLDALCGTAEADVSLFASLASDGFHTTVDAGVNDVDAALSLVEAGVGEVVVALETLTSPANLDAVLSRLGPERVVFSLDLRDARPLGGPREWRDAAPLDIVREVTNRGVRRLILLDLKSVGTSGGWPLEDLVRESLTLQPGLEIVSGGGVRAVEDLWTLADAGVREALVGTAVHTGRLTRADIEKLGCSGAHDVF